LKTDPHHDASSLGVDTAAYEPILSAAAQYLDSADFAAVVEVIGNHTLVLYRSVALEVLGAAEEALADAAQDGLVLGRAEIICSMPLGTQSRMVTMPGQGPTAKRSFPDPEGKI
jgi:hypothetical protein